MRPRAALLLLACACALQGCVAAAAVPLLAGSTIVGKTVLGERTRQAIAEGNEIDPDAIDFGQFGTYALVPGGVLPEPSAAAPVTGAYAELRAFAEAALAPAEGRQSALLEDPTSLEPVRAPCQAGVPAVLVDLDPADGLLPLASASSPAPALVAALNDLRREGIAIAWMTDREPEDAGRIRALLLETRLDPTGRDPLFVMRYPGEEKQRRRRALLETHCLLAIAGDDRRDFDDLYIYLLDPSSALGLEPMIGEGWFLIPTPLD